MQFTLRQESGVTWSALLALLVHLFFLSVLVFGVHWQTRQADAVAVELWSELPPMEPVAPPRVAPVPAPKPDLKVELKPVKPDIAVEKAPSKKPEPKIDQQKRMREELARQLAQDSEQVSRERERQEMIQQRAREATAAQSRAVADAVANYVGRIRAKIKGNIVMPGDMPAGNPEAIFDVVQLPTGEVLAPVRLKKSSGYKPYDEAIERAILKASPLPKPDRADLFQRNLELKFRPLD